MDITNYIVQKIFILRKTKNVDTRKNIILELFDVFVNNLDYLILFPEIREKFASKILEFETDTDDQDFLTKIKYYKDIIYPDLLNGYFGDINTIVNHYKNFNAKKELNDDDIQIDEIIIPFEKLTKLFVII